jgi:hypothetical protein
VVLARAGTLERRGASRDIYPDHNSATGSEGRQHRMVSDGDADWSHSSGELTDCPGCARQVSAGALRETLSPEEFRTVMIELVKIKLLKKLNLKQPPVLNGTRVLPAPLIPNLNNVMQSDDHRTRLHRVASHTDQRLGRPDRTISRRSQTNDKREGTTLEKIALIGEEGNLYAIIVTCSHRILIIVINLVISYPTYFSFYIKLSKSLDRNTHVIRLKFRDKQIFSNSAFKI